MLNKIKNRKQEGFTIIEVLIVLAIAGLILLIVFLAVPALQRNSRNTQRKNDVAAILGALSEGVNNNAGALPADDAAFKLMLANAKLGTYETSSVTYTKNATAPSTLPTNTSADTVVVHTFVRCAGNNATIANATSRSVAAIYAVETSGAPTQICQES